jgi:hypothetical protein
VVTIKKETKKRGQDQAQNHALEDSPAMAAAVQSHSSPVTRTAFSAALGLKFLDGLVPQFFLGDDAFLLFVREFHGVPCEKLFASNDRKQEASHGKPGAWGLF